MPSTPAAPNTYLVCPAIWDIPEPDREDVLRAAFMAGAAVADVYAASGHQETVERVAATALLHYIVHLVTPAAEAGLIDAAAAERWAGAEREDPRVAAFAAGWIARILSPRST